MYSRRVHVCIMIHGADHAKSTSGPTDGVCCVCAVGDPLAAAGQGRLVIAIVD